MILGQVLCVIIDLALYMCVCELCIFFRGKYSAKFGKNRNSIQNPICQSHKMGAEMQNEAAPTNNRQTSNTIY